MQQYKTGLSSKYSPHELQIVRKFWGFPGASPMFHLLTTPPPPSQCAKLEVPHLKIGSSIVAPSPVVRNIGLYMNSVMDMEQQIQKISESCYFHIFSIGKIRHLLNNKSTEILVHAFITSRLDNGNALLYGISKYLLAKLQRVQNAAARLITRTKKQEHITPVLVSLHWLPMKQRIQYKPLLLAYRVIHCH